MLLFHNTNFPSAQEFSAPLKGDNSRRIPVFRIVIREWYIFIKRRKKKNKSEKKYNCQTRCPSILQHSAELTKRHWHKMVQAYTCGTAEKAYSLWKNTTALERKMFCLPLHKKGGPGEQTTLIHEPFSLCGGDNSPSPFHQTKQNFHSHTVLKSTAPVPHGDGGNHEGMRWSI